MAADKSKLPPEIDQLTQKLVSDPKSRVFAQLADAYRKIGMLDEAIETAKRGLEVHPNYGIGHNVLGRCYLEKKMYALASEEFQLTIRSDPQNLVAYKMLATTFEKQGINDEALKYYQMVLDLEPGEIEVAGKIEQLKAAAGVSAVAPEPPQRAPEPFAALPSEEPVKPARSAAPPDQPIQLEPMAPGAASPAAPEPAVEMQIEKPQEPAFMAPAEPEPMPAAEPVEPPAGSIPAAAAAAGEATPTLAEIYAQQGHYEKAIDIYQKLIAAEPGVESYKARMDELLVKAYPDEMAQGGEQPQPEQVAAAAPQTIVAAPTTQEQPPAKPAEAAAEVPDKMFSQMFAEMEKVAVGPGLNIPDGEEAQAAPLQLAPEPAKEEVKLEPAVPVSPAVPEPPQAPAPATPIAPATPASAATPASEPVNFGALFTSDEKSSLGIEPAAPPASGGIAAPGRSEEPKKDEAVSSFQSWLSSLQK